jgi:putative flippase GtrA
MKNYITGKANNATKTEKYLHRLLVGMSVVSIFLFVVFMIYIVMWAISGIYTDEPTFVIIVVVLIVISYFVGKYLDND